jgi:2-C-methyl-D-erythritol 2,4-cyclodiphosphate synthase
MAEKPKLSPYIDSIKNRIADIICIPVDRVGLSATTLEGLGFVGREEGICCSATVVVKKI